MILVNFQEDCIRDQILLALGLFLSRPNQIFHKTSGDSDDHQPWEVQLKHRKKFLFLTPMMGCICAKLHLQGSSLLVTQSWAGETGLTISHPTGWEEDQGNQAKINCFFLQRPLPQRCRELTAGVACAVSRAVSRCGRVGSEPRMAQFLLVRFCFGHWF